MVNQARKLNLEGQQDEALALYRQALARTPDSYDAHYGAGVASDLKGAYVEARRFLTKAIEIAPEGSKVQALTAMAISYVFANDVAKAARFFQQVFDIQTTAAEYAGAAETANALGRVYLEAGDLTNALKWYQTGYETARRELNLPGAQLDLCELRWAHAQARVAARGRRGTEARARTAVVKSLVDKGTNPEQEIQYPYLVGYVDFHLKDYKAAIVELRKADQTDPFILSLLAQANEKSGDRAAARELYRKVLASNAHSLNNAFVRALARKKIGR